MLGGLLWNECAFVWFEVSGRTVDKRGLTVTSEASATGLSTPISTVCVLLSGLHSRTVHDEMMTKERVGEWHNCDGMENSLSKELSQRNWSCV